MMGHNMEDGERRSLGPGWGVEPHCSLGWCPYGEDGGSGLPHLGPGCMVCGRSQVTKGSPHSPSLLGAGAPLLLMPGSSQRLQPSCAQEMRHLVVSLGTVLVSGGSPALGLPTSPANLVLPPRCGVDTPPASPLTSPPCKRQDPSASKSCVGFHEAERNQRGSVGRPGHTARPPSPNQKQKSECGQERVDHCPSLRTEDSRDPQSAGPPWFPREILLSEPHGPSLLHSPNTY